MIDRRAEHDAMIRRVEQAQKAISPHATNRGRLAGMTWAVSVVLDEVYERMTLAWAVLTDTRFEHAKHYTYRAQKAAELSLSYVTINKVYDELCRLRVISKEEQTEPTVYDKVKTTMAAERETQRAERKVRISTTDADGNIVRTRVPLSQYGEMLR